MAYFKIGRLELSDQLIRKKTQEGQITDYILGKSDKPVSFKELFYMGNFLYNHRKDKKFKPAINFLKEILNTGLIQTFSGVLVKPNGSGIVIHDKGLNIEERINIQTAVGPDRYITKEDEPLVLALTGLDLISTKQVTKFLTDKDAYLFRLNDKPDQGDYRVARFYAYSDRAYLYCVRLPDDSDPALGVHSQKIFEGKRLPKEYFKILKGVRKGNIPNSELEKIIKYFSQR